MKAKIKVCTRLWYGTVNRHNCHVWGSEKPHDIAEHEYDSLKVEV
jgi:hypothetical protein